MAVLPALAFSLLFRFQGAVARALARTRRVAVPQPRTSGSEAEGKSSERYGERQPAPPGNPRNFPGRWSAGHAHQVMLRLAPSNEDETIVQRRDGRQIG